MSEWLRWGGRILAVLLMMGAGLLVLVLALWADPANGLSAQADSMPTNLGVTRFLLASLALLLLPLYRRAPLVLIGAGAFCAVVLGTDPFVLAVGLTVWIGRAQKRWEWWIAAMGGVAIAVNAVRILRVAQQIGDDADRRGAMIAVLALLLLCVSLVAGISMWARQRKRTGIASAAARSAQQSSEQLSDEVVRQREREALAREVHDTLASRLSAIALQTGSLEDAARELPELDDAMKTVRSNATSALTDLRSLLTSLREGGAPAAAPQNAPGGIGDLQDLFADAAAAGLAITPFVVIDSYGEAPDSLRRAVVRITQEALTNALRHSSDSAVTVRIEGAPRGGIRLEFANSYGYGPSFEDGSQTGLLGIAERARLVGGTASHHRSDGRFVLTVHLPWDAPAA